MALLLRFRSPVGTALLVYCFVLTLCSGTAILLKPGIIAGGNVVHDCPASRSVGYFLEPAVMLAPFAKKPFQLTLRRITTDENDLSVCVPSNV